MASQHFAAEGWLLPDEGEVRLPPEVTDVTLVGVPEGCFPRQERVVTGPLDLDSDPGCRVFAVDPRRPSTVDTPDVLVVTMDTLRADHMAASPVLQSFAEQNWQFTTARAVSPWTWPSTVALLAGRSLETPSRHKGVVKPQDSLASQFQDAGYRTSAFIGNMVLMGNLGLEAGFDRYELINGDEQVVAAALQALSEDGPQFVYAHLLGGHLPYSDGTDTLEANAGGRHGQDAEPKRAKRLYRATVERHGAWTEALLDAAPYVVFVSDHGEELWDHGGFEHGHAFWEELLRVPLVFRAPGLEARVDDRPARIQDVAPTLLGLLDMPIPALWSGVDLSVHQPGPLHAKHLVVPGRQTEAIVDGHWKLIRGVEQLYDLRVDERTAVDDPEQAERLRQLKPAPSDLVLSAPRFNMDKNVLHLRAGGEGTMTLAFESESPLAFSMDTSPRVCGDVTMVSPRRAEVTLDVAPVACEVHVASTNTRHPVTVTAWNSDGPIEVEQVQGEPLPMSPSGPLAVRVGEGRPMVVDLSELRALGYVD